METVVTLALILSTVNSHVVLPVILPVALPVIEDIEPVIVVEPEAPAAEALDAAVELGAAVEAHPAAVMLRVMPPDLQMVCAYCNAATFA